MAPPKLPRQKAEVLGAVLKNPGRYSTATFPAHVLGDPFARATPGQRAAWEEFRAELPWLKRSHRALLHLACILRARVDADPSGIGVNYLQTYSAVLSKLGATPADEAKVGNPPAEDEDPTDRFFPETMRQQ